MCESLINKNYKVIPPMNRINKILKKYFVFPECLSLKPFQQKVGEI